MDEAFYEENVVKTTLPKDFTKVRDLRRVTIGRVPFLLRLIKAF